MASMFVSHFPKPDEIMSADEFEKQHALEAIRARSFYEGEMAMQLKAIIAIEALKLCCKIESYKPAYCEAVNRVRELSTEPESGRDV